MNKWQNISAAAIQLVWAVQRCEDCMAEFDYDPAACLEWMEQRDTELERVEQAIEAAGIDWRDPFVRQRLRTQGLNAWRTSRRGAAGGEG